MKTSYYAKLKSIDKTKYIPVAISGDGGKIVNFNGTSHKELSPYPFFRKWKDKENKIDFAYKKGLISKEKYLALKEENQNSYIEKFYRIVLKNLDAEKVFKSLGENAVLLCFEKPTEFCHRFLVAGWLEYNLNISVDELGYENDKQVHENRTKLKSKIINEIEKDKLANNISGGENGKEK